jgi:hypothetical protein
MRYLNNRVRSKMIALSSISSDAQSLEHIVGVLTFHKPLALFAFLKHLQGFFIRYFHGKGQAPPQLYLPEKDIDRFRGGQAKGLQNAFHFRFEFHFRSGVDLRCPCHFAYLDSFFLTV